MLHIVKNRTALESATAVFSPLDELILLEDAVYLANYCPENISNVSFVLRDDLLARGIDEQWVVNSQIIDFTGFVELTERHAASLTWE